MIDNEKGGTPPRVQLMRTSWQSYEVWLSDRVAVCNNRAEAMRLVELIQQRHTLP